MRPPRTIDNEQKESLKELLRKTKSKADFQRVLCLWLRSCLSLSSDEIAMAIGWSPGTVRIIQSRYFKEGKSALISQGRGGRRHENLSIEEERQLLERFLLKAKEGGGVLAVAELKAAYEEAVRHPVPKSTVYRMLARHGWRKNGSLPSHSICNPEE